MEMAGYVKVGGKQKPVLDEGFRVRVYGQGIGCVHTNRKDLRAYVRRKAREGFVFVSFTKMNVSNEEPHYQLMIRRG